MSGLAALMLLFPGSFLDKLWQLNPLAQQGFLRMGLWASVLMAAVCAACAAAAVGLWKMALWGYWTAIAILSVNALGDVANAVISHDLRTLIGVPIAVGMVGYLSSKHRIFCGAHTR